MGNRRPPVWIVFWAQLRGDPKKTAVLIVLALFMAGVYARLFFFKGTPKEAAAADVAMAIVPQTIAVDVPTVATVSTETRVQLDRPLVRTLDRNPFTLGSENIEDFESVQDSALHNALSTDPQQRVQAAAAELALEGTMVGLSPLAAINGRVVRPGDSIDGFVLERIEPTRVVIRRHDIRVVLTLKNTTE